MDVESENESSLYSDIIRNLSGLMNKVKLEKDDSLMINNDSNKSVGYKIDKKPSTSFVKHEENNVDYKQQYMNQQQILSLQNVYIQQLTAINQLYCQQLQHILESSCYVWSGQIPIKSYDDAVYSKKVFLGGVPWRFDDDDIKQMFSDYGPIKIEWPYNEDHHRVKGFTYVIFQTEQEVIKLLDSCKKKGNYYYKTNSYFHKINNSEKQKMIEIIPWIVADACYIDRLNQNLDHSKTVFIGGIHGKFSAEAIATIMNDLFGGVAFVGIDVDEHNYPKGAGRVIFNNQISYMNAVAAKFFQIKSGPIQKKIQIDPFVQDSLCSLCGFQRGKFFCRDKNCFRYFCCQCWNLRHSGNINFQGHMPLSRSSNHVQKNVCNEINFDEVKKNSTKHSMMKKDKINVTESNKKFDRKKPSCMSKIKK